MQYDTTINRWNPVKNSGRINSSNPCSEYMFLDDTACNLASLNLMTFVDEDGGRFAGRGLSSGASALTILGQEIVVDHADYPTPQAIEQATATSTVRSVWATRTSGALLMSQGLPYDSEEGSQRRRRRSPR